MTKFNSFIKNIIKLAHLENPQDTLEDKMTQDIDLIIKQGNTLALESFITSGYDIKLHQFLNIVTVTNPDSVRFYGKCLDSDTIDENLYKTFKNSVQSHTLQNNKRVEKLLESSPGKDSNFSKLEDVITQNKFIIVYLAHSGGLKLQSNEDYILEFYKSAKNMVVLLEKEVDIYEAQRSKKIMFDSPRRDYEYLLKDTKSLIEKIDVANPRVQARFIDEKLAEYGTVLPTPTIKKTDKSIDELLKPFNLNKSSLTKEVCDSLDGVHTKISDLDEKITSIPLRIRIKNDFMNNLNDTISVYKKLKKNSTPENNPDNSFISELSVLDKKIDSFLKNESTVKAKTI